MLVTAYNDKLEKNPKLLDSIYQGLKSAFECETTLFINSHGIQGKILDDEFLIINNCGCYAFYDQPHTFDHIKSTIAQEEKNIFTPILEYMPKDVMMDYLEEKEGNGNPDFKKNIENSSISNYLSLYMNFRYNHTGFKTATSLYRFRDMVELLSSKGFMEPVSEKDIESLSPDKFFEFDNMKDMISKIADAATTKKHKFNDGDNAIWKTDDALIITTQCYGYHIVRKGQSMTISAYADDSKKNKTLKALEKDLVPEKLIDNVALKTKGSKVIFSDMAFTFMNLTEDLEIALEEMQSKKSTKPRM